MKFTIDQSDLSAVAVCECNHREIRTTRAAVIVAMAKHLKIAHNDLHAARNAAARARKIKKRQQLRKK